MDQIRLLYYSQSVKEMSLMDLKNIMDIARSNNNSLGICGMLCYSNQYFMQVLEGPRRDVSELFITIANDPRHDDITLMSCTPIDNILFSEWDMGCASNLPLLEKIMQRLEMPEFNPEKLSVKQALTILKYLSQYQDDL